VLGTIWIDIDQRAAHLAVTLNDIQDERCLPNPVSFGR
jgi:hypothetical protein